jgi:transposase
MSTVTNRGHLAFMVFKERFTAGVFLRFVRRLLRQTGRKVLLIVDRHPVHRAGGVQRWLARHGAQIVLFFLPGYSPELNPDEYLNNDVKSNALGRQRPATQSELIAGLRSYLRSTQRQPEIVKGHFREEHVRYAAG